MKAGGREGKKTGFTLIELVIVILMVGIFLPAMFQTMQTGIIQDSEIYLGQQQLFLAEASMEEVTADRNSPSRGFPYLSSGNYGSSTGIPGFTRQVQVSNTTVMGKPAKNVTVTIMKQGIPSISLFATFIDNQ